MICKLDIILKVFIVLALLAVRYTTSSPTENEQKGELKDQMNELKSYMEALQAENNKLHSAFVDLKTENEEIKSDVKKLKAQVYSQDQQNILLKRKIENLELLLPQTLGSYANNMSMENGFSKMDEPILPPSSCRDIGILISYQAQRAVDGIHLVKNPTSDKIEAVFCKFTSSNGVESEELMGYVEVNDGKPNSRPTSCADLWARGNTVPNFYMIQNGNKIWAVYCDFTNGISEKSIGNLEMNDGITNARPTSCDMLWDLGNTVPNFYMIQKENKIKTVYCDFTKQAENTNIESFVGNMEMNDGKTNLTPTSCDDLWNLGNAVPNFYMIQKDNKIKTVYCDFTKTVGNRETFVGNMQMNYGTNYGRPSSCYGLWDRGNTVSDFYMIQDASNTKIKTVYCDFTNGIRETAIGYNDIKTSNGVYFLARNLAEGGGGTGDRVMTFKDIDTNIGDAMKSNGYFTAPVFGIYYLQANVNKDDDNPGTWVYLQKNSNTNEDLAVARGYCPTSVMTQFCAVSATLQLNTGDTIRVYRTGNNANFAHFTGYLLEQLSL